MSFGLVAKGSPTTTRVPNAIPLVAFAERDPSMKARLRDSKPLYQLGQKIVTTGTKDGKRTLQCSGGISVSVGDTKATKEIEFSVQRSADGNISVPWPWSHSSFDDRRLLKFRAYVAGTSAFLAITSKFIQFTPQR